MSGVNYDNGQWHIALDSLNPTIFKGFRFMKVNKYFFSMAYIILQAIRTVASFKMEKHLQKLLIIIYMLMFNWTFKLNV